MNDSKPMHEFMAWNRGPILERCIEKMKEISPARRSDGLVGGLATVIDEVVRASSSARRDAGPLSIAREERIVVECDEDLVVEADEVLLVSAMSNPLQNAMKFTRSGGRVVARGCVEQSSVLIEAEDEPARRFLRRGES